MSNHGPQGGPYPDHPRDPWSGRQPDETYGQPGDPWGVQSQSRWPVDPAPGGPPLGGQDVGGFLGQPYPGRPDPGQSQPAYGQDQAWGQPQTVPVGVTAPVPGRPRPRRRTAVIALVGALAVLAFAGTATVLYLLGRNDREAGAGTAAATPGATASAPASAGPTGVASTPAPRSSTDSQFVKVGQCLRNEAPAGSQPRLTITDCRPQTYEVLQRFDGVTNGKEDAMAKCGKAVGYTDWFFWDSQLDSLDYVLCLKKR